MFFKKKSPGDSKKIWETYLKALLKQEFPKAREALNTLMEIEPRNPQVHMKSGDLLQRMGDTPEAVRSYHKAASILTAEGFGHKALAIYKIIVRLNPKDETALKKTEEIMAGLETSKAPIPGAILASQEIAEETTLKETPVAAFEQPVAGWPTQEPAEIPASWEAAPTGWPSEKEASSEDDKTAPDEPSLTQPSLQMDEWPSMPMEQMEASAPSEEDDQPPVIPQVFASLNSDVIKSLFKKAVPRSYKDGEYVVEEGDTGDSMFVIRSGKARVRSNIMGKSFELATLSAGDLFGEVAFLTGRPRTASVTAVGELKLFDLSRVALQELIDNNRKVRDALVQFYYSRVEDTISKVKKK